MNDVSGSSQLVGERQESGCLSLCVVKEQYLGHHGIHNTVSLRRPDRNTSVVATERSRQLRDLAQRVADALPLEVAEEVVVTGSVSRGVADEVSDIEMLIVTPEQLDLAACFDTRSTGSTARFAGHDRTAIGDRRSRTGWSEREPS